MRESNQSLEKINLGLSIISNAIGIGIPLLGLILGFIELKPGYGLLSKPGPLLTLLYVAMLMCWLWVALSTLNIVKRRYSVAPNEVWQFRFSLVMYVFTIPLSVLWILAFGELLGWPEAGPASRESDSDKMLALIIFGGGALTFGGWLISLIAVDIDLFFNPKAYKDDHEGRETQ